MPHGWKVRESELEPHLLDSRRKELMNLSEEDWDQSLGNIVLAGWVEEEAAEEEVERAVRQAGYIIETQPQSERRGGVEIKEEVSFRRKRVKLYPDRSNKVRSRKKNDLNFAKSPIS